MRRSHRILVEVTLDKSVPLNSVKEAMFDSLRAFVGEQVGSAKIENIRVKEAERVVQAEIRQRQRVLNAARG